MKNDLWNYLKTAQKPIVLYGMGNGADKIIRALDRYGIPISGIFASDEFVRDKTFHGFKITSYNKLKERLGDMIVLMCFGSARGEVLANVKKISACDELYAPDVPVCGETLFDREYYEKNYRDLQEIYDMLADDISRLTFENTVHYKLSGKIEYLFNCQTPPDEPYKTFFKLYRDEIYMDLGAYRGDTVEKFLSLVPQYRHIYAVEPDKKSFERLSLKTRPVNNITLINACAGEADGFKPFSAKGSRGSNACGCGEKIQCVCIDGILNGTEATFIKMDIEGEESNAISGGAQTIKNYKPKMQIACYHRSEDLIDIPRQVLDIRGDYKIYMRHFPSLPAWDTCYYFI